MRQHPSANESDKGGDQYALDAPDGCTYARNQLSPTIAQPTPSSRDSDSGAFRGRVAVLVAVGIAAIALCYGSGRMPLMWPDEGRNAEVGREMKESGSWLIPTYNGADYLDKPSFYFKAVALSLAAFGDSEGAARLPSVVSGLALLGITYGFCRRVCNGRCAALAVMVIATTPLFLAYSRIVIFDITLTLFTCAAIFAGYLAEASDGVERRNWYLLGAAAAGLGTLVKGPVGFIVPALVLLVFNRVDGRSGAFKRLLSPLNLLVFFGTVLPWFVGVTLAHPDFPRYGILEESFRRFTTGSFQRSKPFYFYPLIIAATFFPWSLLLPGSIVLAWRSRARRSRIDRFGVVWCMVVLIFFSLSNSKMPGYILSITVALGILIARVFDRALDPAGGDLRRVLLPATAALAVVGACAAILAFYFATDTVELSRRLRLDSTEAESVRHLIVPLAASLLLLAALAAVARFRRSVRLSFAALVCFPILLILFNAGIFEFVAVRRSARDLAVRLTRVAADAEVACLECLPHGLPFYLRRTVTVVTPDGDELSSNYVLFNLKNSSRWPSTLVPLSKRDAWLDAQKKPVVLIARTRSRPVLDQIAAERGGRVVELSPDYCGLLLSGRAGA